MRLRRRGPSMGICCWLALYMQNYDDIPEWLYQAIQDNKGSIRPLCSECRHNERVLRADRVHEQHRHAA